MKKLMELSPKCKKWLYISSIMLIFIFAFALRVHHLSEKKGFHRDEIYSLAIADFSNIIWKNTPKAGEYTGKDIKNMVFKVNPSISDAFSDIGKLWKDNNGDNPHTNFYYSLFRLSLIGIDAVDYVDFQRQYIFRAGILNLALFTLSFFAFFALLNLLIKDKTLILLGLFVAFVNRVDISSALFFRPYVLQGLFVILFTALMIWISQKMEEGVYKGTGKDLLVFSLTLSLFLLSGYYGFVYAFFLGVLFLVFPIRRTKSYHLIKFFLCGGALALLFDLLFYKGFFNVLTSYRMRQSVGLSDSSGFKFDAIFNTFDLLQNNLFYWVSVVLLLMAITYKISEKDSFGVLKKYAWCIVAVFIYAFLVMFIAPVKTIRYFSSFIFIMVLIYPLALDSMKNGRLKNIVSALIALVFFCIAIKGDGISYKFHNFKMIPTSFISAKDLKDYEVVYFSIKAAFLYCPTTQSLPDDQKIIICKNSDDFLSKVGNGKALLFAEKKEAGKIVKAGFKTIETGAVDSRLALYKR